MEIFQKRLKDLIDEKGISAYKLAKDIDVNKQAVAFWLKGTNEPKITYLYKIARYFHVSTDYLLGIEDENGIKDKDFDFNYEANGVKLHHSEKKRK